MTTTQNLHLPQWEADDRIMHGDFNDAFAAIDTAIAGGVKIATGTYNGNNAVTRTISLGATPKAVFVLLSENTMANNNGTYGGLALPDHPCSMVQVVEDGFKVFHYSSSSSSNQSGASYVYLALY